MDTPHGIASVLHLLHPPPLPARNLRCPPRIQLRIRRPPPAAHGGRRPRLTNPCARAVGPQLLAAFFDAHAPLPRACKAAAMKERERERERVRRPGHGATDFDAPLPEEGGEAQTKAEEHSYAASQSRHIIRINEKLRAGQHLRERQRETGGAECQPFGVRSEKRGPCSRALTGAELSTASKADTQVARLVALTGGAQTRPQASTGPTLWLQPPGGSRDRRNDISVLAGHSRCPRPAP